MNRQRRKEIDRALVMIQQAHEILLCEADSEREYADAMPESMQGGDRNARANEVADELDAIASDLGDIADRVSECMA